MRWGRGIWVKQRGWRGRRVLGGSAIGWWDGTLPNFTHTHTLTQCDHPVSLQYMTENLLPLKKTNIGLPLLLLHKPGHVHALSVLTPSG